MPKLWLSLCCLLLLCGCDRMIAQRVESAIQQRAAAAADLQRPDTITVVTCGTGSPLPSPRAQACTAVFANGLFLLFDSGDGAVASMEHALLPLGALDAVFITHFHSDHFADLGEVVDRSWILGRRHDLPVYGPEGIVEVVAGISASYRAEYGYRTAHHGEGIMPSRYATAGARPVTPATDSTFTTVFERDGVRVTAFTIDHAPVRPALGYRVDFAGRSVVISGDTIATPNLVRASRGADILVSEVMNMAAVATMEAASRALQQDTNAAIFQDIRDYHIGTAELGKLAQDAGVKTLVLTHLVPAADSRLLLRWLFEAPVAEHFNGNIVVAEDGERISLEL